MWVFHDKLKEAKSKKQCPFNLKKEHYFSYRGNTPKCSNVFYFYFGMKLFPLMKTALKFEIIFFSFVFGALY